MSVMEGPNILRRNTSLASHFQQTNAPSGRIFLQAGHCTAPMSRNQPRSVSGQRLRFLKGRSSMTSTRALAASGCSLFDCSVGHPLCLLSRQYRLSVEAGDLFTVEHDDSVFRDVDLVATTDLHAPPRVLDVHLQPHPSTHQQSAR